MREISRRRMYYGWLLVACVLVLFIGRLAFIQIWLKGHPVPATQHTLMEAARLQHERGVVLDSGRGHFHDRHGVPLTGKLIWTAVLFPVTDWNVFQPATLKDVAVILDTKPDQLAEIWSSLKEPVLWHGEGRIPVALRPEQRDALSALGLTQLKVYPYERRYEDKESGMQWLGYISGQRKETQRYGQYDGITGGSGLEKALDPLLNSLSPTVVYFSVDGHNQVIPELTPMVKANLNPYYPLRFTTTIDLSIQKEVERLMSEAGASEGAIVVQDVHNGDVVAMVSSPFYNPERIHPAEGQWENKALQGAAPGSIFKIVTAAAALEAGISTPKEVFHCSGEYGRYGLSCWKKHGHGRLTLEDAFAQSCNVVFAELGQRLSPAQFQLAAQQLGVGRVLGWQASNVLGVPEIRPLDHEESGSVFADLEAAEDEGVRVQTAIGQRDVMMTPLQASNMIVTLLNQGQGFRPRMVSRVSYDNGQELQLWPVQRLRPEKSLSPKTTSILLTWMEKVVQKGTGSALKQGAAWRLAGKSGTAEVLHHGAAANHQWFTGYGPIEAPRYAVSVLLKNQKPGSRHRATELFGKVMNMLSASK
ncbi:penicillin-binding protein 2 [Paenibacillus sp. F411]|uniref:peptidoglycan D,D-transpeptidase FtsI family protein n=1 Tax=Paenibacillus sp. F411 TaxID=2820239 RepID=UPI001AAFB315|nr:penicillin-binding transpeptidase domain-containing protein [Paenibacillus sp. F411]MBO2943368.1 penicillin-binding protein 2 [Paenibacillus sp. F411]